MRVDIQKYFPIIACVIMFLCWVMTYSLLTDQFNYVKSKDKQFNEQISSQKEKIQQLEAKIDSTNATMKNINANLYNISRSTKWMR